MSRQFRYFATVKVLGDISTNGTKVSNELISEEESGSLARHGLDILQQIEEQLMRTTPDIKIGESPNRHASSRLTPDTFLQRLKFKVLQQDRSAALDEVDGHQQAHFRSRRMIVPSKFLKRPARILTR